MSEYWIAYRDVQGFPRQQFERLRAPQLGDTIIRDQVFPAGAGFSAMFIRTHHVTLGDDVVHLITYTEGPVSGSMAVALAENALRPESGPPDKPPEKDD